MVLNALVERLERRSKDDFYQRPSFLTDAGPFAVAD